ncbi:MAG: hypothetical protein SGPRY_005476 [Prymnesium sp.]
MLRLHILGLMHEAMPAPAASLPDSLPRTVKMKVLPEVVGRIIGQQGKTINSIIADTGVTNIVSDAPLWWPLKAARAPYGSLTRYFFSYKYRQPYAIEKSGEVSISAKNSADIEAARRRVEEIADSEAAGPKAPPAPPMAVDQEFKGAEVKNIVPFGVFIELYPGVDGFCHISEISKSYVRKMEDAQAPAAPLFTPPIAIGDKIDVKITQINKAKGQYRVVPTTDVTVTPQADGSEGARRPSGERGRGGRGGGGRRKLSRSGASDAQGE